MKKLIVIITCFVFSIYAADEMTKESLSVPAAQTQIEKKNVTEDIFNDIMQSIPQDVKSQLDSIKTVKQPISQNRNENTAAKPQNQAFSPKEFNNIPEELKLKVEKAMKELDKKQTQRQIEFKDSKRR